MDFETLYAQHFRSVYRFALSLSRNATVAEEVTQETFYRAMANLKDFRGQSQVHTWLCRIAKNVYFGHLRRHKDAPLDAEYTESVSLEAALFDREQSMEIHRHLRQLEEPYREVFTLRVFAELSHSQIASLFGKSEPWARTTFYRAKVQLQERIREQK